MARKRKAVSEPVIMSGRQFERRVRAGYRLSNNVRVRGSVDLKDCTTLTSLPDNLTFDGWLNLEECDNLKSLPANLTVGDWLNLEGCTGVQNPKFVSADYYYSVAIKCDKTSVEIVASLPETVLVKLPGHKIEEVIEHWMLDVSGIRGRVIRSAETSHNNSIFIELV